MFTFIELGFWSAKFSLLAVECRCCVVFEEEVEINPINSILIHRVYIIMQIENSENAHRLQIDI